MDYHYGKFGDCTFRRFGFIVLYFDFMCKKNLEFLLPKFFLHKKSKYQKKLVLLNVSSPCDKTKVVCDIEICYISF